MPKIIKGGPFELLEIQFVTKYQKNEPVKNKQIFSKKKSHGAEKNQKGLIKSQKASSSFGNAQKIFWLGLGPASGAIPLNRITSVPKSGTYRVSSVV